MAVTIPNKFIEAFNSVQFAKDYEDARKDNNRDKLNAMRTAIQEQTLEITAPLDSHPAKIVTSEIKQTSAKIPEAKQEVEESKEKISHKTKIRVVQQDCLYAAQALYKETGRIATVLNMANEHYKGGGYLRGMGAQEEDLFRRTTIVKHLNPQAYDTENGFGGDNKALYSSSVEVFRYGADQGYAFLPEKEQFPINVIWSAAFNLNGKDLKYRQPEYRQEYLARTKQRIRAQFDAALQNNQRDLILSAFGCGAFGNDPKTIAKLYKEVLAEPAFEGQFETVTFAIVPNPMQQHDNYLPFKSVFDLNVHQKEFIRPDIGARATIAANLMNILEAAPHSALKNKQCLPSLEINAQGELVLLIEQDKSYKEQGINYSSKNTAEVLSQYFYVQGYAYNAEELATPEHREVNNTTKLYSHKIVLQNPWDVLKLVCSDLNCSTEYWNILYKDHPQYSPFGKLQRVIADKITQIRKDKSFFQSFSSTLLGENNPLIPVLEDLHKRIPTEFNGRNLEALFNKVDRAKLKPNHKAILVNFETELLALQYNMSNPSSTVMKIN